MKLAYSLNSFRKFSIIEAINGIAEIGYEGLEIMADQPHAWPDDLSAEDINQIKNTIHKNKLQISNVNAFMTTKIGTFHRPSWIEEDLNERNKRIEHTKKCISLTHSLGAGNLSTEPGGPAQNNEGFVQHLEMFISGLRECENLLKQNNLRLLIEPEPGLLIENSTQFLRLIEQLDSNLFGLNCDIGHFFCIGEDIYELPHKLSKYIHHVHLEDIGKDRKHFHLPPGDGCIDFKKLFQSLREINYKGWITVELYPFQNEPFTIAKDSFHYLKKILS